MSKPRWAPLCFLYLGWLVSTLSADAAAPLLVVYQPPLIEAEVGHPVNLSCTYNYTGVKDTIIFGKFYRGNSEVGRDEIESCKSIGSSDRHFSCNLSLTIESPSLGDETAEYCCKVIMPRAEGILERNGSGTKLSLHAKPSSIEILQSSSLVSGHKATLDCKVSEFYPKNPSVLWFCRGTPVLAGIITNNFTINNDGTFSLLSQYTFSPTVKDNNAECVCQASHPAWTQTKKTSITLAVSYGPITVNVTSDSYVVTDGSVRVTNGSTLNLICAADGNPRPKIQWLGGSIKAVHQGEILHIPAVQREHKGLYWCVAKNEYGEQNTSITLLVSYSSTANIDKRKALYGLAVIPAVLVLVTVVIFLLKKRNEKKNMLAGQGLPANGQQSYDVELARSEGIIYAEPKKCKKKPKHQNTAPSVLESSQLVYTDIMFPQPPRNQTVMKDEPTTIYSDIVEGRGRGQDRRARKQAMDSVYTLAKMPQ